MQYRSLDPTLFRGSPQDRAKTEGEAFKGLKSGHSATQRGMALPRYLNELTDKDIADKSVAYVKSTFPDLSKEEKILEAKATYRDWKKQKEKETTAGPEAMLKSVKAGGGEVPFMSMPDHSQRADIESGKRFNLTSNQIIGVLMREAKTPEELEAAMSGKFTPEQISRGAGLAGERHRVIPKTQDEPGFLGQMGDFITQSDRIVQGGATRAHEAALEATKDVPLTVPQEKERVPLIKDPDTLAALAEIANPVTGPLHIPGIVKGAIELAQGERPGRPTSFIKQAVQGDLNVAGVPISGLELKDIPKMGRAFLEGGAEGHASEYGNLEIAQPMKQAQKRYADSAVEHVKQTMPDASKEEKVAAAKTLYKQYLDRDPQGLWVESPNAATMAFSIGADPLTYLPLGNLTKGKAVTKLLDKAPKVAKALTIGGGAVPGAIAGGIIGAGSENTEGGVAAGALAGMGLKAAAPKILEKGSRLLRNVSHRVELKALDNLDPALRQRILAEEAKGQSYTSKLMEKAGDDVREMQKLSKPDRLKLGELIEEGAPIPEHMKPAHAAHMRSADRHAIERSESATGIGKRYDDQGQIIPPEKVANYLPRQGSLPVSAGGITSAVETAMPTGKAVRGGVTPGSSLPRQAKAYTGSLDVAERWAKEWTEFGRKAGKASEVKGIDKILKSGTKGGLIRHVDPSKVDVEKAAAALSKKTGVPWTSLDAPNQRWAAMYPGKQPTTTIGDVYRLVSGKPGEFRKGAMHTLVPESVAYRLEDLAPLLGDVKPGLDAYQSFMNGYIRPMNKMWRTAVTISVPGFHVRNAVSGASLSFLALGAKAANPKLHLASASAGILGAAAKNKGAQKLLKKIPWTMNNGKKTNLLKIWKRFEQVGLGSQLEARFASEALPGVTTGKVPGMLQKATRGLDKAMMFGGKGPQQYASPAFWGRATENYQHFVTFLGFLDDMTEAGVAKALDLSSKYSGNYSRLGAFEKNFLRDGFSFYAWSKFIGQLGATQLVENPGRLAAYIKAKHLAGNTYSDPLKPGWAAKAPYTRDNSIMMPTKSQPWKLRGDKKKQDYDFASMSIEDPLAMSQNTMRQFMSHALGGEISDEVLADQFVPILKSMVEYITQAELRQGRQRVTTPGLKQAYSVVERPSEAFINLIELLNDNGRSEMALNLYMRFKAERDFAGLNRVVAEIIGKDSDKAGVPGAIPGLAPYLQNEVINTLRQQQRAQREAGSQYRQETK